MKKYIWNVLPVILALAFAVGCGKSPAESGANQLPFDKASDTSKIEPSKSLVPGSVSIPAGTPISVRLQSSVSTASSRSGDSFDAVIDEPVVVGGQTVIPRGAEARGRVVSAASGGHLHHVSYLRLTLSSVSINGKSVPVETSSIAISGKSHKKRNLVLIGGGAGTGALIGALAGGGKGALIGSAVGAGAGTAGAYATGKKDVGFAAERRLTFRLTQSLSTRT